jgi:hypothetical protein
VQDSRRFYGPLILQHSCRTARLRRKCMNPRPATRPNCTVPHRSLPSLFLSAPAARRRADKGRGTGRKVLDGGEGGHGARAEAAVLTFAHQAAIESAVKSAAAAGRLDTAGESREGRADAGAGACGWARVREQNGERACAEEGIRASRERASELGASVQAHERNVAATLPCSHASSQCPGRR